MGVGNRIDEQNFLFLTKSEEAPIKIIDFGLSRHKDNDDDIMKTKVGKLRIDTIAWSWVVFLSVTRNLKAWTESVSMETDTLQRRYLFVISRASMYYNSLFCLSASSRNFVHFSLPKI